MSYRDEVMGLQYPVSLLHVQGFRAAQGICAEIAARADTEIAALRAELAREIETNAVLRSNLADPPPDVQEAALKRCGHFEIVERLRTECNQWREELRIYRETESADTARLNWLLHWLADPVNCRNIRFDRAMIDAEREGGGNG
jgi:hypothetical protein